MPIKIATLLPKARAFSKHCLAPTVRPDLPDIVIIALSAAIRASLTPAAKSKRPGASIMFSLLSPISRA